jgi:hypothetical protein
MLRAPKADKRQHPKDQRHCAVGTIKTLVYRRRPVRILHYGKLSITAKIGYTSEVKRPDHE